MTQLEVSVKSGVNRSDLSRIVNGKFIPSEQQKEAIAEAMRIPVDELFKDCPDTWTQVSA
jgi:transcriptional regulator with XRE-family HTH domain